MRHDAYYLIRPRELLRGRAQELGLQDIDWLLEPQLLHKGEADRSGWRPEDHAAQVKLLFLAQLRTEFEGDADYQKLFGSDRLAVEAFDRWWTLEVHHSPDEVPELERALDLETIRSLELTGRPVVDRWITELLGRK